MMRDAGTPRYAAMLSPTDAAYYQSSLLRDDVSLLIFAVAQRIPLAMSHNAIDKLDAAISPSLRYQ